MNVIPETHIMHFYSKRVRTRVLLINTSSKYGQPSTSCGICRISIGIVSSQPFSFLFGCELNSHIKFS